MAGMAMNNTVRVAAAMITNTSRQRIEVRIASPDAPRLDFLLKLAPFATY